MLCVCKLSILHTCLHADYRYEDRELLVEADSTDSSGEVLDIFTVFPRIKAQMFISFPTFCTRHLNEAGL